MPFGHRPLKDERKTLAMLLAGLAGVDDGADVVSHVGPVVFAPGLKQSLRDAGVGGLKTVKFTSNIFVQI
jgi:hypothetical protein